MKCYIQPHTLTDSLNKHSKLRHMDMRLLTYNVISLNRVDSLMTVSKDLSKYKLYLVGIQEVRWDIGGTEPAGNYIFRGKRNENH
jgi:hypothetical protein